MNQPDSTIAPQPSAPDIVPMEDISQFAGLVAGWHNSRLNVLEQLLAVPDGATFEIGQEGNPETETITLSGDMLRGFKFGVEMAKMQVKTLPFVVEFEDQATPAGG